MDSKLTSLLETNPYGTETAAALEGYVLTQLTSKTYDFVANKSLLKNYQVNINTIKPDIVCKILILSLMRLPSSDFISISYMIPTKLTNDANIAIIKKCADSLERGKFREFWEQFVPAQGLFSDAVGFVDAIRLFIVSNMRDTFKSMAKPLFQQHLGLDEKSVVAFCDSNKFIEEVTSDVIIFTATAENQNRIAREDEVNMDEAIKLAQFLRSR